MRSTRRSRCSRFRFRASCIRGSRCDPASPGVVLTSRGGLRRLGPIVQPRCHGDQERDQRFEQEPYHLVGLPRFTRHAAGLRRRCAADRRGLRDRSATARRIRHAARHDAACRATHAAASRALAAREVRPVAWSALPGWTEDSVERNRGPRFASAARRSSRRPRRRAVCGARRAPLRIAVDRDGQDRGPRVLRAPF